MNPEQLRELAVLREFGFTHLDPMARRGDATTDVAAEVVEVASPEPVAAVAEPDAGGTSELPVTGAIVGSSDLEQLGRIAAPCTRCRLCTTRTQVVFGTGNPNAELMFVGEAPGRDEDLQGEPFVGRAGQLLTDIIKAMKLSREQVYIANVIKCRPPENRNPEPDELDACRPYILKQIELIKPRVIVTLGRFPLQSLTQKAYSISSVRGEWLEAEGIKLMPTYHPAYLLRTPAAKKDVWADMKKVMTELGIAF